MVLISNKSLSLFLGVLLLSGCALPGGKPAAIDSPATPSAAAATLLGNASPGDVVDMPRGNPYNEKVIVVGDDYTAASGRLCRRLRSDAGQQLSRIVCQKESGEWYSPRALSADSNQAVQKPFVPITNSTSMDKPVSVDVEDAVAVVDLSEDDLQAGGDEVLSNDPAVPSEEHVFLSGETLWSFSRRVTGNALNWNAIAELNNIDDSRRLSAGDSLLVPKSLVRGEL